MVIIIPGAGGKIGFALTNYLFNKGHKLILGDNSKKQIELLKRKFKNSSRIILYRGDLTKQKNILKFIKTGIKRFKTINCAVNCLYPKSKNWNQKIGNIDEHSLGNFLKENLGSTIIFSQEIIKVFLKNGEGKLVNISSIQGVSAPKFDHYNNLNMDSPLQYTATKSSIIGLTKYLAKYYGKKNITVNCLSPGGIKNNQEKKFVKKYKNSCLIKGLLDAKDICGTIDFLISKNSNYINGQNIIIDDGWSL